MAKKQTKKSPPAVKRKHVKKRRQSIDLNRILVPIDFSEHSRKALQYAIPFAMQFNASIDLVYVVEPTIYPADFSFGQVGFPNVEDELRRRGAEELDMLIEREIAGVVPARKIILTGKASYEIITYAGQNKIDLIIIATHGHSGFEHALFGSTTEKVVRKAPCPVLVVRTGARGFIH